METESTHAAGGLTVIIPVYNEEKCLRALKLQLDRFLVATPVPATVLFVNDGSTDGSQAIIENICDHDAHYHFLLLSINRGLSTALKAGIDSASTEYIGYIDADIQTSPLDFLRLLRFIPEYDFVTGVRQHRQDTLLKRACSRVANYLRRKINHDAFRDMGCPLKIGKARYLKSMPFFDGMHRFLPSLVQLAGGKVCEIPIAHFQRYAGNAKYGFLNRIFALIDMLAFRWMQNHYIRYQIGKQK